MPDSLETRIAGVLAEHRDTGDWPNVCACGLSALAADHVPDLMRAHVAAEIARALGAETRVEWGHRDWGGDVVYDPEHRHAFDVEYHANLLGYRDVPKVTRNVTTIPPLVGDWQETDS